MCAESEAAESWLVGNGENRLERKRGRHVCEKSLQRKQFGASASSYYHNVHYALIIIDSFYLLRKYSN